MQFELLLVLVTLVALNVIGFFFFTRLDLTAEKRYSISGATKDMLSDLDDIVYFKVYLDGEFPAGFKKLRNETREMLDEFRAYSNLVEYEFINPSGDQDKKVVERIQQQLMSKGLMPTRLHVKNTDGESQQIIFPAAIVSYKGREIPLTLLLTQQGVPSEAVLNNSVQALEFNLADAIRKAVSGTKQAIGMVAGHGELAGLQVEDIWYGLSEYYRVEPVLLNGKGSSLFSENPDKQAEDGLVNRYVALIVAKPEKAFSQIDKFLIDQFIMRGGKVLWLVDPVFASMDSLQYHSETLGVPLDLNLQDQLFHYGARLNTDLLLDLNALPIPVVTGNIGSRPQTTLLPWPYFPLLTPVSKHPVVCNLNAIRSEFVSSIDTVGGPEIRKTVLLHTSRYTHLVSTPARISLDLLMTEPDQTLFSESPRAVAVLLEGSFNSVFSNTMVAKAAAGEMKFYDTGKPNKMIVVADGDIIKNQVDNRGGEPMSLPLGYDRYTNQSFGNRDFILNCVNYLCDETGLLQLRAREFKLRMLDKNKVAREKLYWQLINTLLPVLLVVMYGIGQYYGRKRKYGRG